jgi:importin-9
LLSASLHHLQVLFPTFTHFYLSSSVSAPNSSEDEHVGLPHLVCPLIDFVSSATRAGKAKEWFDSGNLPSLVGAIFNYVQMTDEDVSNVFFARYLDY